MADSIAVDLPGPDQIWRITDGPSQIDLLFAQHDDRRRPKHSLNFYFEFEEVNGMSCMRGAQAGVHLVQRDYANRSGCGVCWFIAGTFSRFEGADWPPHFYFAFYNTSSREGYFYECKDLNPFIMPGNYIPGPDGTIPEVVDVMARIRR